MFVCVCVQGKSIKGESFPNCPLSAPLTHHAPIPPCIAHCHRAVAACQIHFVSCISRTLRAGSDSRNNNNNNNNNNSNKKTRKCLVKVVPKLRFSPLVIALSRRQGVKRGRGRGETSVWGAGASIDATHQCRCLCLISFLFSIFYFLFSSCIFFSFFFFFFWFLFVFAITFCAPNFRSCS